MTQAPTQPASADLYDKVEEALDLFGIPNSAIGHPISGRKSGVEITLAKDEVDTLRGIDGGNLTALATTLRQIAQETQFGYRVEGPSQNGAYTIYMARSYRGKD